jgi:hypothetical protein
MHSLVYANLFPPAPKYEVICICEYLSVEVRCCSVIVELHFSARWCEGDVIESEIEDGCIHRTVDNGGKGESYNHPSEDLMGMVLLTDIN